MNSINMKLVKVEGKTRQDLLNALASLGEMDLDFCGENGSDYLWENIDQEKYESNMEYLLDILKDVESDKELIEQFISKWIDGDNYYQDHILDVVYDKNSKAECIALATMS